MLSDLAVIAASLGSVFAGALAGELLRRRLNRLDYRSVDETGLPAPGDRYWVAMTLAVALGLVG